MQDDRTNEGKDIRQQRRAAALRENLKRRKAQLRGRKDHRRLPCAETGTADLAETVAIPGDVAQ